MNTRDLVLFSLIIVGTVAAGLIFIQIQGQTYDRAPSQQPPSDTVSQEIAYDPNAAALQQQDMLKRQKIRTDFENTINTFLQNVDTQVAAYQRKRNAIRDMVKPENMRQFEYVAENKAMATEVISGMEADMDQIIASFPVADQAMRNFLNNNKNDELDTLLGKWESVKNEQLALYVDFFSMEKELLAQYQSVFDIYLQSEGGYQVDAASNEVSFSDAALTRAYMETDRKIQEIIEREKILLGTAENVANENTVKANSDAGELNQIDQNASPASSPEAGPVSEPVEQVAP